MSEKVKNEIVPDEISENEFLARIILHSYHYSMSKKKMRPEVFMPSPREQDEISTLRFSYTNINACKSRGLQISKRRSVNKKCTFIGVAFVNHSELIQLNKDNEINKDEEENFIVLTAIPRATPLNKNDELRKDRPVYRGDEGLPSHADIKFNENIFNKHKPVKQIFKQRIAKPLVKLTQTKFFKDLDVSSSQWKGDSIQL